jgi:hypothetical protein
MRESPSGCNGIRVNQLAPVAKITKKNIIAKE